MADCLLGAADAEVHSHRSGSRILGAIEPAGFDRRISPGIENPRRWHRVEMFDHQRCVRHVVVSHRDLPQQHRGLWTRPVLRRAAQGGSPTSSAVPRSRSRRIPDQGQLPKPGRSQVPGASGQSAHPSLYIERMSKTARLHGVATPSAAPRSTTSPLSQATSRRLPCSRSRCIDDVMLAGS